MSTEQHRTRWTTDEVDFLVAEWDGTHATAEVIAEILGRTVAAVSQRWYETQWGTAVDPVATKPESGEVSRITVTKSVTTTVEWTTEVCPTCYCAKSANGTCCCTD